jgi:hypothetical protein
MSAIQHLKNLSQSVANPFCMVLSDLLFVTCFDRRAETARRRLLKGACLRFDPNEARQQQDGARNRRTAGGSLRPRSLRTAYSPRGAQTGRWRSGARMKQQTYALPRRPRGHICALDAGSLSHSAASSRGEGGHDLSARRQKQLDMLLH